MLVQHGKDDLETPFAKNVAGDEEHGKESHDDDLKKSYGKDDLETPVAEDVAGDKEHGKESYDDDFKKSYGNDDLETPVTEDVAGDKEHGKESHDDDFKKSHLLRVFESIDGAIPSDLLSSTRNSSTKDDSTGQSRQTCGKSHPRRTMMMVEAFQNKLEKLLKVTKGLKAIKSLFLEILQKM
ncbi:hypothetical protein ACA910_015682 [Epithemia clementina (nom. ined.)]